MPGDPTTNFATVRVSARLFRHALPAVLRVLLPGISRRLPSVIAAFVIGYASVSGATADSLEWSPDGVTPGGGGTGTWNTNTALWFDGIAFQDWNNAALDDAVFGGTAGTVTLEEGRRREPDRADRVRASGKQVDELPVRKCGGRRLFRTRKAVPVAAQAVGGLQRLLPRSVYERLSRRRRHWV